MLISDMRKIRLVPDLRDSNRCVSRAVSVTKTNIIHSCVEEKSVHLSSLCDIESALNPCTFFRTVWETFT